jgi:hypothetical protein
MTVQWRTRVVIELHAPLSEKPFLVGKHVVVSRNELRGDNWPKNITIIDVVLKGLSTSDVERAHIAGIDVANTFLDRVSVVAYSPCSIVQIISTAPQSVAIGRPFTLATHDQIRAVESPMVNPADISGFQTIAENSVFHEAAHHARKALSEGTAEQHLLHLHIAAERIAVSETTERVKNTCPSCGASWDGPPASRRAVRTLLTNRKVSSADCDDAIQYRSRIAHGGGKRDLQFYERVTELAGAVEGAVLSTIAERCGLKILRRTGVVVGLPISIHQAVKNSDGSFSLLSTRWKAPIRFPAVSDEVSLPGGVASVGFPTNPDGMPRIDPAAWPE